ncbi:uncharacterized protein V1510DRAFT_377399 [Dipodascopsis tothii]|uniref:uncharacterized protein n=1 Tax=Dipodascopsis tothii TaxID=44089 RepID=UPI0034CF4DD6
MATSSPQFLVAVHDFKSRSSDELELRKGDFIEVIETDEKFSDGWYIGRNVSSKEIGLFPYVYSSAIVDDETDGSYARRPSSPSRSASGSVGSPVSPRAEPKHALMYQDIENTLSGLESRARPRADEPGLGTPVPELVYSWNTYQVAEYFSKLGFDHFICDKFIEHKITGAILLELELAHLKELEINSFGTRFEINKVVDSLRRAAETGARSSPTSHHSVLPLDMETRARQTSREQIYRHSRQRSHSLDLPRDQAAVKPGSLDRGWQLPQTSALNIGAGAPANTPPLAVPRAAEPAFDPAYEDTDRTIRGVPYNRHKKNESTDSAASGRSYVDDMRSKHRYSRDDSLAEGDSQRDSTSSKQSFSRSSLLPSMLIGKKKLQTESIAAGSTTSDEPVTPVSPDLSELPVDGKGNIDVGIIRKRENERREPRAPVARPAPSPKRTYTEPTAGLRQTVSSPKRATTSGARPSAVRSTSSASNLKPRRLVKQNTSAFMEGIQNITPKASAATSAQSGWMNKRGGGSVGTWKSRFFTLHGTRLSYFASLSDTKERGLIDITAHRVVPVRANEDKLVAFYAATTGSGRYCFKLMPPAPGSRKGLTFTAPRVHYFAVETHEEMRAWMSALMKATIDRDDSVPVISSCSTPTISLAKARELNALAMETRAAELRAAGERGPLDSPSELSTPDLSMSKESDGSENSDPATFDHAADRLRDLSLNAPGFASVDVADRAPRQTA